MQPLASAQQQHGVCPDGRVLCCSQSAWQGECEGKLLQLSGERLAQAFQAGRVIAASSHIPPLSFLPPSSFSSDDSLDYFDEEWQAQAYLEEIVFALCHAFF